MIMTLPKPCEATFDFFFFFAFFVVGPKSTFPSVECIKKQRKNDYDAPEAVRRYF